MDKYQMIIVDDEKKIADGIANLFPWEEIGFRVVACFYSAEKALEFIENNSVDVVLSDIEMPDMNGIDLCRNLFQNKSVKVVLFSSYQNYEYFRGAIQYAAEDYLLKPIRYAEVLECFGKVRSKLDAERKIIEECPLSYYENIIERVMNYLHENYRDASLEEAAEEVCLSASYLSKIFKEKSGFLFSEVLTEIRMNKAKELLDNPQYKSYDIAYLIGYDNPKNFSRAFKTYFQMSPSEYRSRKNGGIKGDS